MSEMRARGGVTVAVGARRQIVTLTDCWSAPVSGGKLIFTLTGVRVGVRLH